MKRYLIACGMALAVLAFSGQKASAWSKFNFNVGLNISYEAADNCFLWGFFKNGPAPSGRFDGGYGGYGGYDAGPAPQYYNPQPYGQPLPHSSTTPTLPAPGSSAPANTLPQPQTSTHQQIGYYYYGSSSYYQVPSYWYGN